MPSRLLSLFNLFLFAVETPIQILADYNVSNATRIYSPDTTLNQFPAGDRHTDISMTIFTYSGMFSRYGNHDVFWEVLLRRWNCNNTRRVSSSWLRRMAGFVLYLQIYSEQYAFHQSSAKALPLHTPIWTICFNLCIDSFPSHLSIHAGRVTLLQMLLQVDVHVWHNSKSKPDCDRPCGIIRHRELAATASNWLHVMSTLKEPDIQLLRSSVGGAPPARRRAGRSRGAPPARRRIKGLGRRRNLSLEAGDVPWGHTRAWRGSRWIAHGLIRPECTAPITQR